MLLSDLISHTRSILPLFSSNFTSNTEIGSVNKSGDTVTIVAPNHNLADGDQVILSGIKTDIALSSITTSIAIASLTFSNGLVTVTTTDDHRLVDRDNVAIDGADQSEYNGTFPISATADKTFTYKIAGSPDSPATGTITCNVNDKAFCTSTVDHDLTEGFLSQVQIISDESQYNGTKDLLNVFSSTLFSIKITGTSGDSTGTLRTFHNAGFNGVVTVDSVADSDTFTFTLQDDRLSSGSGDDMLVMASPRISGAATLDRAIAAYTKMDANELWGFFVFQGMDVSDDRTTNNDSKAERLPQEDFKLRLVNDFTFYVFVPTKDEISGRSAIDLCQQLAAPIYKTLAGFAPSSQFRTKQETVVVPSSHNFEEYSTPELGPSVLIYGYDFQTTEFLLREGSSENIDDFMANTGDVLPNLSTRAFRNMNWQLDNEFDNVVKNDDYHISE
jgi:hypothetical protein